MDLSNGYSTVLLFRVMERGPTIGEARNTIWKSLEEIYIEPWILVKVFRFSTVKTSKMFWARSDLIKMLPSDSCKVRGRNKHTHMVKCVKSPQ